MLPLPRRDAGIVDDVKLYVMEGCVDGGQWEDVVDDDDGGDGQRRTQLLSSRAFLDKRVIPCTAIPR